LLFYMMMVVLILSRQADKPETTYLLLSGLCKSLIHLLCYRLSCATL
jgi:hypothetical protein